MKLKMTLILATLVIVSSVHAKGIIVLRCAGLENIAENVKLFQITLAEAGVETSPNQVFRDASEVRVNYTGDMKSFQSENVVFQPDRNPKTSKFLIGVEENGTGGILKLRREKVSAKKIKYTATVLQTTPRYEIFKDDSSDCVVTERQ